MSDTLLLRPFDKLFVKDGRPLSLEDDSAASGLFPPPPSVYYGALRSAGLSRTPDPSSAIGTPADPAQQGRLFEQAFHCSSAAFAKTEDTDKAVGLYFPAPADLVRAKEKDKAKAARLLASRLRLDRGASVALTSSPTPALLRAATPGAIESVGAYISGEGLAAYLRGEGVAPAQRISASKLHEPEPKLGIALNYDSGTTGDGMLYTMAMQRLKPGVTLVLRTEGFGESPNLLRLGAEARAVEVTQPTDLTWPVAVSPSGKTLTLYLATPAIFRNGWLPDAINPDTLEGELGGAKVKLLACSLGRYTPLGGWDIRARRPKPMRKAVPAGSVYHFEIADGETFDPDLVHGKPLHTHYEHSGLAGDGTTERPHDHITYQQQGFGIAYVGVGPQEITHA